MNQDKYFYWLSTIIGILSIILFFIFAGWKLGVLLILVMWSNNLFLIAKIRQDIINKKGFIL